MSPRSSLLASHDRALPDWQSSLSLLMVATYVVDARGLFLMHYAPVLSLDFLLVHYAPALSFDFLDLKASTCSRAWHFSFGEHKRSIG